MTSREKIEVVVTATDNASRTLEKTTQGAFDLQNALTGLAVVGAAKAAYELGELGAQSLRMKDTFEAVSGGAQLAQENLDAMRAATRGAMTEQEMMINASRLMQMGLASSSEELETLSTMAIRLGTAMGTSAAESMESFALMLANQSIPRLDTFGISSGRVRTRIEELQAATAGMTREQAFLQAVMEEGTAAMDRLGDAGEDELLQFERLTAEFGDTKAALGELVAGPMSDFLKVANAGLTAGLRLVRMHQDIQAVLGAHEEEMYSLAESYSDYITEMERAAEAAGYQIDEEGNLVEVIQYRGTEIEKLIEANFALTESNWETQRAEEALAEATENQNRAMEASTARMTGLAEHYAQIAEEAEAAREPMERLSTTALDIGKSFQEGIPDATDMWNMILGTGRAAGMTAEELGVLAKRMGVADDATVQSQIATANLIDQWEKGEISIVKVASAAEHLEKYTRHSEEAQRLHTEAAKAAEEGNTRLSERLEEQAEKQEELAEEMLVAIEYLETQKNVITELIPEIDRVQQSTHVYAERVAGLAGYAEQAYDYLMALPTELYIDIYYQTHGGAGGAYPGEEYQAGAWNVPRTGPAVVHAGEMIIPAPAAERIREQNTFNLNIWTNATSENLVSSYGLLKASIGRR